MSNMRPWLDTIKRATGADAVDFVTHEGGEFSVRVQWHLRGEAASTKSFEKRLTRQLVFGDTAGLTPLAVRVQKRTCDYAKMVMREVLEQRGLYAT